ncbi:MAG: NUDIX domain-containing protein [Planctomycetes bacterium]|nr:NUDIX domain-containing protein [Planctomycetota bacterium]
MADRRPLITTRAIILHRGHVLFIRAEDPGREWFFLPGGLVEHGETLEQACAREVLEETALKVHVRRPLYLREFIAERHQRRSVHMPGKHHVMGVLFLCELAEEHAATPIDQLGTFQPDEGARGVKGLEWIPMPRVPEIEIMPPHVKDALMGEFPPPADRGMQFWPED